MSLSKAQKDALERSIVHWTENMKVSHPSGVTDGPKDCALCRLVNFPKNNCNGCPIAERTGKQMCDGTPYGDAHRALEDWHDAVEDEPDPERIKRAHDDFMARCQDMIDFLISLRDD